MICFLICFFLFFFFTIYYFFFIKKKKCLSTYKKCLSLSWNTGQWKTSEFIPFQWIEEQPPPLYEWIDSLSYFTVESWIVESTAERTSLSTLSSLNCQHNFTSSTLNWLVCDCLSDEMEGLLFCLFFFSLSFFFFLFSLSPLLFLFLFLFFFSYFKECENPPPSSKVGFGRACSGLPSTFIIPSTHLIFQQNSLKFKLSFLGLNFFF